MRSDSSRLLTPLACLLIAGCTTVARPPEFVERVGRIEEARLMQAVHMLHEIGPRPIEDRDATARTVSWIREQLEGLGLDVTEEQVTRPAQDWRYMMQVRAQGAGPDAEVTELEFPPYFGSYGLRVTESLSQELRAEGWEVLGYVLRKPLVEPAPVVAPNLFAEIRGVELPDRVIEVSAHYDTVPGSSGASDNSAGVAVLLELARVLADCAPRKTIRLCFFAGEEARIAGSPVHVEHISRPGQPVVEALVNVDSVGHATDEPDSQDAPVRIPLVTWMPSTGDFIAVIGTFSSGWLGNLFEAACDAYVPELPYYSANRIGGWFGDARRSDHAHYWDAGIPAIFLTDTGEFRSDDYHRPSDTPETVNSLFLQQVARATAATVLELTLR